MPWPRTTDWGGEERRVARGVTGLLADANVPAGIAREEKCFILPSNRQLEIPGQKTWGKEGKHDLEKMVRN